MIGRRTEHLPIKLLGCVGQPRGWRLRSCVDVDGFFYDSYKLFLGKRLTSS